jgi:hypothetical protein
MCFEAQFVNDASGMFNENAAGLCFFTIVTKYSLLIVQAITPVRLG